MPLAVPWEKDILGTPLRIAHGSPGASFKWCPCKTVPVIQGKEVLTLC